LPERNAKQDQEQQEGNRKKSSSDAIDLKSLLSIEKKNYSE